MLIMQYKAGTGPAVTDDVKLLMHAEDLTDSSPSSRLIIAATPIDPSGKFDSALDMTGSHSAQARDNQAGANEFNPQSSSYTIDFWVKWNSIPATEQHLVWRRSGAANPCYRITYQNLFSSNQLEFIWGTGPAAGTGFTINPSLSTGQWYHIAFTREYIGVGTSWLRGFIDGALVGSTQTDAHLSRNLGTSNVGHVNFGSDDVGGDQLDGYMDEIRISKGVAYYTAPFTPPTTPY